MNAAPIVIVLALAYLLLSSAILFRVSVPPRGRHRRTRDTWEVYDLATQAHWSELPNTRTAHRACVYESWCQRRSSESPIFARLAAEMGLGLALGVAA